MKNHLQQIKELKDIKRSDTEVVLLLNNKTFKVLGKNATKRKITTSDTKDSYYEVQGVPLVLSDHARDGEANFWEFYPPQGREQPKTVCLVKIKINDIGTRQQRRRG